MEQASYSLRQIRPSEMIYSAIDPLS